jgi:hypothetical protein
MQLSVSMNDLSNAEGSHCRSNGTDCRLLFIVISIIIIIFLVCVKVLQLV